MPAHRRVSVAIPVYNGAAQLPAALRSVLDQTRPPDTLRVFDNASTDDTVAVAGSLVGEEQVVGSAGNVGAVANFNRAARAADGDYFMWLAADDRLHPRFVESCLAALESDPAAVACLTAVRFVDPDGAALREQRDPELASADVRRRLRSFLRRRRWTEFYCLYRREPLLASPLMLPEYGADVLFSWWLLLRGPFAYVDTPLLDYTEYPAKTVEEVAEVLLPGSGVTHWRKVRMWRRLWQLAAGDGVARPVRRRARAELALALLHPAWWAHLAEDVVLRWPQTARPLRQVERLLDRGGAGSR